MATSDNRIPANRVALLFMVLLAIWVGWLFVPKAEKPKVILPPIVVESKLRSVGLPDNPDWEGLPELFAIWTDQAGWKDDKAQFAYWDPGSQSYSYFFEASRQKGTIRFRSLSKTELNTAASVFDEETKEWNKAGRPTQFESPEHPFVFFRAIDIIPEHATPTIESPRPRSGPMPDLLSGLAPEKLPPVHVPPVIVQPPALPNEPVKK